MMGKLFGTRSVIVGTPSAELDKHRHQPNGDSVIVMQHLQWAHDEERRRNDRLSTLCDWMGIPGSVVVLTAAFVLLAPYMAGWAAFLLSIVPSVVWVWTWGKIDPYGGG